MVLDLIPLTPGVLGGGGGTSISTDAIWQAKGDTVWGIGPAAAARQPVGANDKVQVADSAQTVGSRWDRLGAVGTGAEITIAAAGAPAHIQSAANYIAAGDYDEDLIHQIQDLMVAGSFVGSIKVVGGELIIRSPIRLFLDGLHLTMGQRGYIGGATSAYMSDRPSGGSAIRPNSSFVGQYALIAQPLGYRGSIGTLGSAGSSAGASSVAFAAGTLRLPVGLPSVQAGGSGYVVGDVLTLTGAGGVGTQATLTVQAVSSGAVTAATITTAGSYTTLPSNPVGVTGGSGTGATFNFTHTALIGRSVVPFTGAASDQITGCTSGAVPSWPAGKRCFAPLNLVAAIKDKIIYASADVATTVGAAGSGYAVGDIIEATPSATTKARFRVETLSGSGVATVSINTAGSYTSAPSNPVATTAITGVGTGCTLNPPWRWALGLTSAENVTSTVTAAAIVQGGTGYTAGDVLDVGGGTVANGANGAQITVSTVSGGVITAVTVSRAGSYSRDPRNAVYVTGGTGTGATFNLTLTSAVSGADTDFRIDALPTAHTSGLSTASVPSPTAWVYNPSGTNYEIAWTGIDVANSRLTGIPVTGDGNLNANAIVGTPFWFTLRALGGVGMSYINFNGLKSGATTKTNTCAVFWQVNEFEVGPQVRIKNFYLDGFVWDGGGKTGFPRSASESTMLGVTIRACLGDALVMRAAATDSQITNLHAISPGRHGIFIDGGAGCQFTAPRISASGDYSLYCDLRHIQFKNGRMVNCYKGGYLFGNNIGGGISDVEFLAKNCSKGGTGVFDAMTIRPTSAVRGINIRVTVSSSNDTADDSGDAKVRYGLSLGDPDSSAATDPFISSAMVQVFGGTTPSGDSGATGFPWVTGRLFVHPLAQNVEVVRGDQLPITTQTGTAYTLAQADANSSVEFTNAGAITATIPADATVALPVGTQVKLTQAGAGAVTATAAGGVTLNGTAATAAQWQSLLLLKRAANTWLAQRLA